MKGDRYCRHFFCTIRGDLYCCAACIYREHCCGKCLNDPSRCGLEDAARAAEEEDEKAIPGI